MKKGLFILTILFIALYSTGQDIYGLVSGNKPANIRINEKNGIKETTTLYCDTLVVYMPDSLGNDMLVMYAIADFDSLLLEHGNAVYELNDSGSIELSDTTVITYYPDNKIATIIYYDVEYPNITPIEKDSFVYNSNGLKAEYYSMDYDETNQMWENYEKDTYEYDANGNVTVETELYWDNTNAIWVNDYKTEYTYNSEGETVIEVEYVWNTSNNAWDYDYKTEYMYDSEGNKIKEISSYYSSGWVYSSQYEWVYNNNMLKEYIYYNWNATQWDTSYYYLYEYDANGYLVLETKYYDASSPSKKMEYTNDANGNPILVLTYYYSSADSTWENSTKEIYAYDSNGNIIEYKSYDWDDTNGWEFDDGEERYYDLTYSNPNIVMPMFFSESTLDAYFRAPLDTIKFYNNDENQYSYKYIFWYKVYEAPQSNALVFNRSDIQVYPNPFVSILNIKSDRSVDGTLEISTLDGRTVMTKRISGYTNSVVVPGLSNGIYLVRIKDTKGNVIYRTKVVKR